MPAPDRPRHAAETRFVASIYRRARDADAWSFADLTTPTKRKRPSEPESDLAAALRRAALDE